MEISNDFSEIEKQKIQNILKIFGNINENFFFPKLYLKKKFKFYF